MEQHAPPTDQWLEEQIRHAAERISETERECDRLDALEPDLPSIVDEDAVTDAERVAIRSYLAARKEWKSRKQAAKDAHGRAAKSQALLLRPHTGRDHDETEAVVSSILIRNRGTAWLSPSTTTATVTKRIEARPRPRGAGRPAGRPSRRSTRSSAASGDSGSDDGGGEPAPAGLRRLLALLRKAVAR